METSLLRGSGSGCVCGRRQQQEKLRAHLATQPSPRCCLLGAEGRAEVLFSLSVVTQWWRRDHHVLTGGHDGWRIKIIRREKNLQSSVWESEWVLWLKWSDTEAGSQRKLSPGQIKSKQLEQWKEVWRRGSDREWLIRVFSLSSGTNMEAIAS